jgi:hypothetical protein
MAKTIGFGAEITGAFGQVQGAYGGESARRHVLHAVGQGSAAGRRRARQAGHDGIDYSNEAGDTFRQRAADILPDPKTAHASEQVVAGLADFATRAVGYGITLGPLAPPVWAATRAGGIRPPEAAGRGPEHPDQGRRGGWRAERRRRGGAADRPHGARPASARAWPWAKAHRGPVACRACHPARRRLRQDRRHVRPARPGGAGAGRRAGRDGRASFGRPKRCAPRRQ